MLKEIKFTNKYENEKGTILITFNGTTNKDAIDFNKIDKILNNYLENLTSYNEPSEIISLIRTIFEESKEQYLEVFIMYKESFKFLELNFANQKLSQLTLVTETNQKDKKLITMKYNNINDTLNLYKDSKEITDNTYDYLKFDIYDLIDKLNYIKPKTINKGSITLYNLYKVFYEENPDFTSKYINIKFQTMKLILDTIFNQSCKNYSITSFNGKTLPISKELTDVVNRLTSLSNLDKEINIISPKERIINDFGKAIRKDISEEDKLIDTLIKFSNILYFKDQNKNKTNSEIFQEITSKTNYSKEEVQNVLNKLRKTKKLSIKNNIKPNS